MEEDPASSAIFPVRLIISVSYLFSTPTDRAKNPLFATVGDTLIGCDGRDTLNTPIAIDISHDVKCLIDTK